MIVKLRIFNFTVLLNMNKITVLRWIIALLIVLNASTIATIIYHNAHEKAILEDVPLDIDGQSMLNGRFMRQNVGFDDQQMNQFRRDKQQFQPEANEIIFSIERLKSELFVELNKPKPDPNKINEFSDQIGNLHADLKKKTSFFYLQLRQICHKEQDSLIVKTFQPLFNNSSSFSPGQGGFRHRHGHENQQPIQ